MLDLIYSFMVPAITLLVTGMVIGSFCYLFKKGYEYKNNYAQKNLHVKNIIPIIHSQSSSLLNSSDNMITIKTHMNFIKSYEQIDKNLDINIIIHTVGGSLSSAEAICNCIMNHQLNGSFKGKFIAYIPYYSYSGGCMIALTCDKIIMLDNAILGPCDAQKSVGNTHSIASIIDAVAYKKSMKDKITETWLANSYDAILCKDRQLRFVEKLVKLGKFSDDAGKILYDEFFSGKYNHDKIFSAKEAQDLGLNIEIVNLMPSHIKTISDTLQC